MDLFANRLSAGFKKVLLISFALFSLAFIGIPDKALAAVVSNCNAQFDAVVVQGERGHTAKVTATINGCNSDRWQDLRIESNADSARAVIKVLETSQTDPPDFPSYWRPFNVSIYDSDSNLIEYSTSIVNAVAGIGNEAEVFGEGVIIYTLYNKDGEDVLHTTGLPWGDYDVSADHWIRGNFKCLDADGTLIPFKFQPPTTVQCFSSQIPGFRYFHGGCTPITRTEQYFTTAVCPNENQQGGGSVGTTVPVTTTPTLVARPSCGTELGTIDLVWTAIPGSAGYRLSYSTDSQNGSFKPINGLFSPSTTSYIHPGLTPYINYYYRLEVIEIDDNGNETVSGTAIDFTRTEKCLTVSCSSSPNSTLVDESVTWRATASGGSGIFAYLWSGHQEVENKTDAQFTSVPYLSAGDKEATVTVWAYDTNSALTQVVSASCNLKVEDLKLEPFRFSLSNGGGLTINTGQSGATSATASRLTGISRPVGLLGAISGLTDLRITSITPVSGSPLFTSAVSLQAGTTKGDFLATITGSTLTNGYCQWFLGTTQNDITYRNYIVKCDSSDNDATGFDWSYPSSVSDFVISNTIQDNYLDDGAESPKCSGGFRWLTDEMNHTRRWECTNRYDTKTTSFNVTVTAPVSNLPDLTASAPTPSTANTNVAQTYSAVISNVGTASTGKSFSNFFQTATAANGGGVVTDRVSGSMATLTNGGTAVATSPSITFTSAGTYSIRVCADKTSSAGGGDVAESNENNNCSAWTNVTVTNIPVPVVTISANPTSGIVNVVQPTITWSATNNPTSCTASGDWKSTPATATSGNQTQLQNVLTTVKTYTYTLTCTNAGGTSALASAAVVVSPAFNYSLSNSGNITVNPGSSGSNTIARTLVSGTTQAVTLSASVAGSPAGVTVSFTNNPANPLNPSASAGNSALTINTTSRTPANTYTVTVTGAPLSKTTTFTLTVSAPLSQPTVTATTGSCGGIINLAFVASPGAVRYELSRMPFSADDLERYGIIKTYTTLPASDTDITYAKDIQYRYQLRAVGASNDAYSEITQARSSEACRVNTPVNFIATPGACVASSSSTGTITLSWQAPVTDATHAPAVRYEVRENNILLPPPNGRVTNPPTTISNLPGGVSHTYEVKAFSVDDIPSDPVSITSSVSLCATPPTVSLSASPNPVAYNTAPVLTWTTTGTPDECHTNPVSGSTWRVSGNKGKLATNGPETQSAITSATTYSITCTKSGVSSANSSVTVNVLPQRPTITTTVTSSPACASASSPATIRISWPSASQAASYKLYRSASGRFRTYGQIPNASTNVTSPYSDTGRTAGSYYYQLQADNANGSSYSDIVSISVPACFDYSLSNSGNITVNPGASGSNIITKTLATGTPQSVTLSVSGLPSGASATFTSNPGNPTGTSNLTINSGRTSVGTYSLTVNGSSANTSSKTTGFTLNVTALPIPITVSLSASSNPVPYNTAPVLSWTTTGTPDECHTNPVSGSTWRVSGNKGKLATNGPETQSAITTATTYAITCTKAGVSSANSSVTVNVTAPVLSASCSVSPTQIDLNNNQNVTWTAVASGGVPPYTYRWAGDAPLAGNPTTVPTSTFQYDTIGRKIGQITVTDNAGTVVGPNDCSNSVTVTDSRVACNFALIPDPASLNMSFISNKSSSNKTKITILITGCSDTITLSSSPSSVGPSGSTVPVTYEMFDSGTLNQNNTIPSTAYARGLDFGVKANNVIATGTYPITITGTGTTLENGSPIKRTVVIPLNVKNVRPVFQEF